jgi:hypothetical protein
MQFHVLECLEALSHAKRLFRETFARSDALNSLAFSNNEYKKLLSAKDYIFASAISVILDDILPYKRQ